MDSRFLEFWGEFFLSAAKGQKQLEQMARWMNGSGMGPGQWVSLFRRCYGLNAETMNSGAWDRAMQQFQSSAREWLALMNVVPRSERNALEKENASLREKIAAQQETIGQLRQLLAEKGVPQSEAIRDFSRLMEKQSKQFQELMGSVGRAFTPEKDS